MLFNLYLDIALKSNSVLHEAIIDGKLIAFADDIVFIFQSEIELNWLTKALQSLAKDFNLNLHPDKSVFIHNGRNFRKI